MPLPQAVLNASTCQDLATNQHSKLLIDTPAQALTVGDVARGAGLIAFCLSMSSTWMGSMLLNLETSAYEEVIAQGGWNQQ